jgi:bacterioferritin
MVSKKLLDMLNKAVALDLRATIQYMWQYVQWSGVKGFVAHDVFKKISLVEMRHCETIAERPFYLGETPTVQPEEIDVGKTLPEMIKHDVEAEAAAIKVCKEIIQVAEEEGDVTTAYIIRKILEETEDHHKTFTALLTGV